MHVAWQVCFTHLFEKWKGRQRTWVNPMSSKEVKSLYEIAKVAFRLEWAILNSLHSIYNHMNDQVHFTLLYSWKQWFTCSFKVRGIMSGWSGRCGVSRLMTSVISKVAQLRLRPSSGLVLYTLKLHCGGSRVNKRRREWIIVWGLTRPSPKGKRICHYYCPSY